MSDDLPAGSVNLEDDGPELEPVASVVETPVEPPAEAKPAEVEAVEVGGEKYVPVAAVIAERKQRQELAKKAERVDALEAEMAQARPYVEFLKNNPDLLKPRETPAPAPSGPPAPDQESIALAQVLDLYTADGKPDTNKAQLIRQMMRDTAQAEALSAVQPYQQQSHQAAANENFHRVLHVKDASGQTPTEESVRAVWGVMPPADLANPQVAGVLAALALGLDRMRGGKVEPPDGPPLVSEPSGGSARVRPVLSALEERVAAHRGTTQAKWAELTKDYKPGRSNVLEED